MRVSLSFEDGQCDIALLPETEDEQDQLTAVLKNGVEFKCAFAQEEGKVTGAQIRLVKQPPQDL